MRGERLAVNYLLVLHRHPPITIREEERSTYLDALAAWDLRQDLEPLMAFLADQMTKTWDRTR